MMGEQQKSILKSKTFWAALITAVAPLWPPAAAWIAANPAAFSAAMGLAFGGLRVATKSPVKKPKLPLIK